MSFRQAPTPFPSSRPYTSFPVYSYPTSSSNNAPSECPAGSYVNPNAWLGYCSPCQANTYSSTAGAKECTTCPSQLKSGLTGSTTVANCINAPGNSIFGIVGIVFATYALLDVVDKHKRHKCPRALRSARTLCWTDCATRFLPSILSRHCQIRVLRRAGAALLLSGGLQGAWRKESSRSSATFCFVPACNVTRQSVPL